MHMVLFQPKDDHEAQAIVKAMENAAPGILLRYFSEVSKPAPEAEPTEDAVDPVLVKEVVKAIQPAPRHFVLSLLYGDSSWWMSRGDARSSIRPETIALSRRLKPVFPLLASPIDALVVRQREYFPEGGYKGIKYTPTLLGVAVREALKAESHA
ncbi:hypothetical protein [Bradyrhizobium genosp. A]|uniref:hypothetical protein n=1 Tax=Bradyrhizobium genosp. A TaxID=83626 RepID=UPI003CEC8B56